MTSRSGRFVITFNGEIYNYLSLRQELERCGQAFIGSGDTRGPAGNDREVGA